MGARGKLGIASRMDRKRAQVRAPTAMPTEPLPPCDLSEDSQAEWTRIIGLLRRRGDLDALDQAGLRDYLTCWSRLLECEADLSTRGILVKGERGMIKNPAAQLARVYRDSLLAWSKEFGFTPGSRERMAMAHAPAPKKNRWDVVD